MSTFGFSHEDAKRIGRAVRLTERDEPRQDLSSKPQDALSRGVRIMLGTHGSASWAKNSQKTITVYGGYPTTTGVPPASAYTVTAYNIFADVPQRTAVTSRWVAMSCNGFAWYLIAAEC